MRNIVFCFARAGSITYPRCFSTTARICDFGAPSRPIKTTKYVQILHKETRDPVWRLVESLHTPQRVVLSEALASNDVSVDDFAHWKPVLRQSNIAAAVSFLQSRGFVTREADAEQEDRIPHKLHPPSWLVLFLAGYKVRTPVHAHGVLVDLVYTHLDRAPSQIQGPLLVFTVLNLARFNLLLPMRRVIETFLTIPLSNPALHFNLLLQALSCAPVRSVETGNIVVALLKTMESRQLRLRSDTYDALLTDRFVTLQLTKYLRERMVQEGFIPQASHLEAYLRIFAKNGAIHDAKEYFDAIHTQSIAKHTPTPIGPERSSEPSETSTGGVPHRASTLLLSAQGDRASAFQYLMKLVKAENAEKPGNKVSRVVLRSASDRSQSRLASKQSIDVFDWTATFSVAANDPTTTSNQLIRLFNRVHSKYMAFRPTIATYTVLIRGLLRRKKFRDAEKYWRKLLHTGLVIDKQALTVGLQTLTRVGKPHEAFALLERFAARVDAEFPAVYKFQKPVVLTAISMNEFLVALNRISRPDIVFKLWDYMGALYGVFPDAGTLSILLQSVRLALKMDNTFSGAVAQLALKNPFRKPTVQPSSRQEMVSSITVLLGDPGRGLRPYVSGIWNDQIPLEPARKVFQQVMFGVSPDQLVKVRSPANPIRSSVDIDSFNPMAELTRGLGLPSLGRVKSEFISPPDLLAPDGRSHYPQIVPNNSNCFNYITLLGVSSRAAEIPLTLAWMRALGIYPSRSTLSVALVFWAEISMQAPLIEKWSGGSANSEYAKLVEWIIDWVGEQGFPKGTHYGKWVRIIEKMRESP